MALNVSSIGNNPQQPSAIAQAYLPDQLIAGPLQLVTDPVTVSGSALIKRGTLMGAATLAALSSSTGTAQASGTITVTSTLAVAGDTLTVNGTVVTVVAADPQGNQVLAGPDQPTFARNLESLLTGSTDVNISKLNYTLNTGTNVITTQAKVLGTAGNAYTLATSNSSAFTLSGANLTGGVANTGNATVGGLSLGGQAQPGVYRAVCLTATTAQLYDPTGDELGVITFGTPFVNPNFNVTITAGGTPCVVGDGFNFIVGPGTYKYVVCTAGATDGSQAPLAVLADDADPSSGDVSGGVFLLGEFNTNYMTFGAGINPAQVKQPLRILGIFLKSPVSAADPI